MHDGSEEVLEGFPYSTSGSIKEETIQGFSSGGANVYGDSKGIKNTRGMKVLLHDSSIVQKFLRMKEQGIR